MRVVLSLRLHFCLLPFYFCLPEGVRSCRSASARSASRRNLNRESPGAFNPEVSLTAAAFFRLGPRRRRVCHADTRPFKHEAVETEPREGEDVRRARASLCTLRRGIRIRASAAE